MKLLVSLIKIVLLIHFSKKKITFRKIRLIFFYFEYWSRKLLEVIFDNIQSKSFKRYSKILRGYHLNKEMSKMSIKDKKLQTFREQPWKGWSLKVTLFWPFFSLSTKGWRASPTVAVVETLAEPIDKIQFPAVTICPKNFNSDRWGPTLKILDFLRPGPTNG